MSGVQKTLVVTGVALHNVPRPSPARGRSSFQRYGVRLRDVATGAVLGCFAGHTAPAVTVAFSPAGRTALSAGWDNTIRLLQLPESGEEAAREPGPAP